MKQIQLTRGMVALVDDSDFERANKLRWHAHNRKGGFYAARNVVLASGKKTKQLLHMFVLPGVPRIDHKDGDGLNCQKHNLRPCSQSQNCANRKKQKNNTSGFRGVYWHKYGNCWSAEIHVQKRRICLGNFTSVVEAARAYDTAAKKYFGEFARFNFP